MEKERDKWLPQKTPKKDFFIAGLLPTGKENAISTKDLLKLTGCKTVRELQAEISNERRSGAVICSGSSSGYWLPANENELREFISTTISRARNTFKATRSARELLKALKQQQATGRSEIYNGK